MIAPDAPFVHPLGDGTADTLAADVAYHMAYRELVKNLQADFVARHEQAVREGKRATLCVGKLPHERGAA